MPVHIQYYLNTTATVCPLLLGDLVFKLHPGPAHTSSCLNGLTQNIQRSRSTRNTGNLDSVRLYPSDQQLTMCTLNARSLNNKSAAFLDLVCDVREDLFTIILCETIWLKDHHSAVLSELTLPRYRTLKHCPRPGCRGGSTALLVKEGINVSNVCSDEKMSFEVS